MDRPIGVIDSGSGGLSIVDSVRALLPHESIAYIGDHAHAPYSEKTKAYIRKRVKSLITACIENQCKMVVVACNTATVAGIDWYRKQFPNLPIVGVVPTIKTAASLSKNRKICVLSTKFTAKSAYQQQLITAFARDCMVYGAGSTNLVSFIESGNASASDIANEISHVCRLAKKHTVDTVVLGCTHYPFVRDQIQAYFGPDVQILDSGAAVAQQVERILRNNQIQSTGTPTYKFFTTGDPKKVSTVMSSLERAKIVVEHCPIA